VAIHHLGAKLACHVEDASVYWVYVWGDEQTARFGGGRDDSAGDGETLTSSPTSGDLSEPGPTDDDPRQAAADQVETIKPDRASFREGAPTFAAVIPTYQREHTVGRAIESAIAQTFPPLEIIVVDDGSTDGTQALLETFPTVRSIKQSQSGSAAARNHGARAASATWIAFLDSDDWWEADHLERLARAIDETDGVADLYFDDTAVVMHTFQGDGGGLFVGSLWEFAGFAPPRRVTLMHNASECVLLPVQPIMLQSSAIRRQVYLDAGGLSTRLRLRHDTHLFIRLGLSGPACAVFGIGARMTDEGGEDRLTWHVPPSSKAYWDETAILYDDVVRRAERGSAAHRLLAEQAAIAHWRRARHELSARRPHTAIRPLISSIRMRPSVVVDRLLTRFGRRG
jgi:hypothetical protein